MMRGRFAGFGTAAAGFGAPVSLRAFLRDMPDPTPEALGVRLMAEITKVVPILPVPLVAAALLDQRQDRAALRVRVELMADRLVGMGAVVKLPPQGLDRAVSEGLAPLLARGIVVEGADGLQVSDSGTALLGFYAASVQQVLKGVAAP